MTTPLRRFSSVRLRRQTWNLEPAPAFYSVGSKQTVGARNKFVDHTREFVRSERSQTKAGTRWIDLPICRPT